MQALASLYQLFAVFALLSVLPEPVTKDDFALNARTGIKSKTISADQRKIEIERLKEDAKKLDKQMAQKAHVGDN